VTVVHVLPSLDSSIRSDDTFASPLIEKERLNSPVTSWFCVGPFEKLSERSEAVKKLDFESSSSRFTAGVVLTKRRSTTRITLGQLLPMML
jgi:hypothetical protein